ncbi:MAG: undecaprenyl-phosphate glucose phosphotransferase [Cellulosilyticaceae bacterium]
MIRENQKYLNKLQIIIDIGVLPISFLLAYYIRFHLMDSGLMSLTDKEMLLPFLGSIPIFLFLYNLFDLYSARRTKPLHMEVSSIIKSNIIGFTLLTVGLFVFKLVNYSRLMLAFCFILNTILTVGIRIIIKLILKKYRKLGYNLKHCIVIGSTNTTSTFLQKVKTHPHWGYHISGIIKNTSFTGNVFAGHRILGDIHDIASILDKHYADMVFITLESENMDELGHILHQCEKAGVKTSIIPYYHKYIPAKPYMDDLDGLPVIDIRHVPLDNLFKNLAKRAFDILFSLVIIILTSPLLLFSALMVRLSSPGPILFKQERVGLNRKNFYMYKFRSMKLQTEEDEKDKWTTKNDPRKTRWGTFMRKTSIDELPQFFNVLMGDMSVVGPRPERPFFVDKFKEDIPRYMIKHQVRPGITGWAQVNGFRGDTSIEGRIDHDLYYIENWTFTFDIKIIFMTLVTGFVNKNAY